MGGVQIILILWKTLLIGKEIMCLYGFFYFYTINIYIKHYLYLYRHWRSQGARGPGPSPPAKITFFWEKIAKILGNLTILWVCPPPQENLSHLRKIFGWRPPLKSWLRPCN